MGSWAGRRHRLQRHLPLTIAALVVLLQHKVHHPAIASRPLQGRPSVNTSMRSIALIGIEFRLTVLPEWSAQCGGRSARPGVGADVMDVGVCYCRLVGADRRVGDLAPASPVAKHGDRGCAVRAIYHGWSFFGMAHRWNALDTGTGGASVHRALISEPVPTSSSRQQ
jgi:hypothetical protein